MEDFPSKAYRIKTNLIHNGDASLLNVLLQLHHRRRNVRRRDDILLSPDGSLDHRRMVSVRNKRDDKVILR